MGCGWLRMLTTVVLLAAVIVTASAIGCDEALGKVQPCVIFVVGTGGETPAPKCCSGAQLLDKIAANSPADKKALCECLKQFAQTFPVNSYRASQLPILCHLTTNLTLSPDLDCNN
ncbi:non-specific lipid-transfer protein-like [Diospyros lotus]|uniref:non-specific lipid-transfer protein-like n=1 Tax=Diospyros lotus TaxID=55363 RepID=UPI002257413C|nr:non-specific lipid-transfer protein-like [Diospyros lotus]